eukprot:TRINITY_DN2857_c0_g1_i1.p1 TRINITY_DN2857_c0_g1~~TRINITY_DN2857_c0_g1_i1.p1  ORF type:complete len:382 (+),score=105.13 TRINITY_DN2857_c0_g1_i1:75-1220(+)
MAEEVSWRDVLQHRAVGGPAEHPDGQSRAYAHTRAPQEVEQVNVAVQTDTEGECAELCRAVLDEVAADLPTGELKLLWNLFCTFDTSGGMNGKLDQYELTGLMAAADPEAGARDVAKWIRQLDVPASGETEGDGEVSFVELVDWWDRVSTAEGVDGADRLASLRDKLLAAAETRTIHRYTTIDGWTNPPSKQLVDTMSPGEIAVSCDGLLHSLLQVRFWLESKALREAEAAERKLYNEARRHPCCGLSTDEHERFSLLFRRYLSALPGAEEEQSPEEPQPTAKAAEKIRVLQSLVDDGEMTTEEFEQKKDAVLRAEARAGPALTVQVGDELKGLCGLLGVTLTFRDWEVIHRGGVYQPRMDLHSFLCFAAVRLGRVTAPDQ